MSDVLRQPISCLGAGLSASRLSGPAAALCGLGRARGARPAAPSAAGPGLCREHLPGRSGGCSVVSPAVPVEPPGLSQLLATRAEAAGPPAASGPERCSGSCGGHRRGAAGRPGPGPGTAAPPRRRQQGALQPRPPPALLRLRSAAPAPPPPGRMRTAPHRASQRRAHAQCPRPPPPAPSHPPGARRPPGGDAERGRALLSGPRPGGAPGGSPHRYGPKAEPRGRSRPGACGEALR